MADGSLGRQTSELFCHLDKNRFVSVAFSNHSKYGCTNCREQRNGTLKQYTKNYYFYQKNRLINDLRGEREEDRRPANETRKNKLIFDTEFKSHIFHSHILEKEEQFN